MKGFLGHKKRQEEPVKAVRLVVAVLLTFGICSGFALLLKFTSADRVRLSELDVPEGLNVWRHKVSSDSPLRVLRICGHNVLVDGLAESTSFGSNELTFSFSL